MMDMAGNVANRYIKSKTVSLIILAVTAMICSRLLFFFFNEPDGPNLLIVIAMGLAVYFLSSVVYVFAPVNMNSLMRIFAAVIVQILTVSCIYFFMR